MDEGSTYRYSVYALSSPLPYLVPISVFLIHPIFVSLHVHTYLLCCNNKLKHYHNSLQLTGCLLRSCTHSGAFHVLA